MVKAGALFPAYGVDQSLVDVLDRDFSELVFSSRCIVKLGLAEVLELFLVQVDDYRRLSLVGPKAGRKAGERGPQRLQESTLLDPLHLPEQP